MSEVHFTYNGLEGTLKLEDIKTEEELHHKLCVLFNINESIDKSIIFIGEQPKRLINEFQYNYLE